MIICYNKWKIIKEKKELHKGDTIYTIVNSETNMTIVCK